MPSSKKRKKKKSPKFKKEINQPDLTKYIETPQAGHNEVKKRTPPTPEILPAKKLNMSDEDPVDKEDEHGDTSMITEDSDNSDNSSIETESNSDEEPEEINMNQTTDKKKTNTNDAQESNSLTRRLKRMEKRITASIEKMIEKALQPLRNDIKSLSASKALQDQRLQEVNTISKENVELKKQINDVKAENQNLKQRLNCIENKLLENNFILQGVQEDAWETYSGLCEKVYQVIAYTVNAQDLQVQMENARKAKLVKVKRIGVYSRNRGRPISVQFEHYSAAQYFWENKSYIPDGIFVKHEYTEETERNRRILKPIYNAAKKNPTYRGKCKMDGDILTIRGKTYGLHNLSELPDDLSGHRVTSRNSNLVLGFFGELHPLSNFHRCNFSEGGLEFSSSEQYIQYTKAYYFENMELAGKILNTDEPLECKKLAREIKYPTDKGRWSDVAKELCYKGIKQKFVQNENLMQFLLHTGNKTIVESSMDKLWGTGIPLYIQNCLDPKTWCSQGLLGEILTEIRRELNALTGIPSSNQGTLV